jgi:hypothetical protein
MWLRETRTVEEREDEPPFEEWDRLLKAEKHLDNAKRRIPPENLR